MADNLIGEKIMEYRASVGMTQDQFGARYEVSGPAIFKFEKGYVKPSLNLWMKIAKDFGMSDKKGVLLWIKSKLPEKYQNLIDLKGNIVAEDSPVYKKPLKGVDYTSFKGRDEMRKFAVSDRKLPRGLKSFIKDDEVWALYKPTGLEINILRDTFSKLGEGEKSTYREALRLIRSFSGAE